jgi:hypothetical protein
MLIRMGILSEVARIELDGHVIEVEAEIRLAFEYRLLVDKVQLDSATARLPGSRLLHGELADGQGNFVVYVKQGLTRTRYLLGLDGREIPMAVCPLPRSDRRRRQMQYRRRID